MAKGLTIKDALKIFEEKKGVVAAEAEKVLPAPDSHALASTAHAG